MKSPKRCTTIFLACCLVLSGTTIVNADELPAPTPPRTNPNNSRRIEVRLSMSRAAADALSESRIRRLFELELDDVGTLAPGTGGPLGDSVAHVWLDVLSPPQVLIEVRFAERPVTRRFIAIEGLSADVSARLVAIAANELVRTQARPIRPRKEPKPRLPTAKELELASRRAPAIVWSVGPSFSVLPPVSGFLWGPNISLGFRALGASEHLFARWQMGSAGTASTRWLEVGLAVDDRIWLHERVRLAFGADAAFAFVHLGDVRATEGISGQLDAWSGRAGGIVGVDVRATRRSWIGFHFDPGAVLRPVSFADSAGKPGKIAGFWLGFGVTFQIEHLLPGFAPTTQH
ncbi:MAG TPA: hypothetical protein PK156_30975 [Polyangium sp.]|nr:hypothetical protein [Polyangium sp.]